MLQNEIIYTLLTTGIYNGSPLENIHEINAKLRQIHFEVIEYFDKSCYILKNNSSEDILVGYNEIENMETLKIFEKLVHKELPESNLIPSLVSSGWVEYDDTEKLKFSKKSLVIFKDLILEINGRYFLCKICNFLVDSADIHNYCRKVLHEKDDCCI